MPLGPFIVTPIEGSHATLTPRELQVLAMIAEGMDNKEMATTLFRATKTIEKHRANLMEKLGIHNVAELTRYQIQVSMVETERRKVARAEGSGGTG